MLFTKEGYRDDLQRKVNVTSEEHNVEIDGLPIRYLAAGEGPPAVLLHGAGDNALGWRWVMPALAAAHRVYVLDLSGSPDSARPAAGYSPASFERFVASFVDALGIGRATFVGNSLGGLIALRLALSEPARVGALVLIDRAPLDARDTHKPPELREPFGQWVAGPSDRCHGGRSGRGASRHLEGRARDATPRDLALGPRGSRGRVCPHRPRHRTTPYR